METFLINVLSKIGEYIDSTPRLEMIFHFFIFLVVYKTLSMVFILKTTKSVSGKNMLYSRPFPGGKKILIVGDSTAVGTGAGSPDKTIAGLFAKDFPETDILNLGVNGSLTRDVLKQLKQVENTKFEMIIISTGGNDVWNFTRRKRLRKDLRKVLETANEMSDRKVITLFFGNEGSAPLFPSPVRIYLMYRTEKIKNVFSEICEEMNVPLVELFTTTDELENPFVKDPKRFFAKDMLHPSSEGYFLWYKRLWRFMVKRNYLYSENNLEEKS